jgi:ferric iron reductase protein FhuF
MSPTSVGAAVVYADVRRRWLDKGVELMAEDPTDRPGDGWVRISGLCERPDLLADLVTSFGEVTGVEQRKAAASLLVKRLSSLLAFPATVAWRLWRRVPDLSADNAWVRIGSGRPDHIAFDEARVWVGPDDELRGPGVIVERELPLPERLLVSAYEDGLGRVIDAVNRSERTGSRHLWGNLALTTVNSALWAGASPEAWHDGEQLCARRTELARTLEILESERHDTGTFAVALRRTCCMAYADPGHGYCESCSLLDHDERVDNLTHLIGDAGARAQQEPWGR